MKSRRSFWSSYSHAKQGIWRVLRTQRNIWIQIGVGVLVILAAIYFRVSKEEVVLLLLTIGLVISAELLNTAFEALSDSVAKEYNPHIQTAKDVAAGAVLVAALISIVIGILIFGPRLVGSR